MNHFYNNKEDALRDKLLRHEFAPVPGAWDQMAKLLDDQAPVTTRATRKAWWWWSATALLLTGSIIGGTYLLETRPAVTTVPAIKTPVHKQVSKSTMLATHPVAAPVLQQPTQQIPVVSSVKETSTGALVAPSEEPMGEGDDLAASDRTSPRVSSSAQTNATPKLLVEEQPVTTVDEEQVPEATVQEAQTKLNKKDLPILKRRTEIIYQYSTTPLRTLQQKRQQLTPSYQGEVGDFGITEELKHSSRPLQASLYAGGSIQASKQLQSIQLRPVVGVQADYRLSKHHGIQLGAQYRSMATHLPQNSGIIDPSNQTKNQLIAVDAIEIPISYQLHPHPRYHLKAGVTTSLLVNAQTSETGNMPVQDLSISPVGVSLLVGAEYEINKHWSVALQYNYGLLDVITSKAGTHIHDQASQSVLTPAGSTIIPTQWRGSDVQLLLKYRF